MNASDWAALRVEQALHPVRYRVYPDTPLSEVMELMTRRGIHAVPVVGDRFEVLGIVTAGDAMEYLLRRGMPPRGEAEQAAAPVAARDAMTRSVLCVSEDQSLVEAANMMVSRDVEQLPVVRAGEFIGFVTRETILRALYGPGDGDEESSTDRDTDS
ncbi:MAG: CBS domain-containing protein [Gemmatimonadota bacterium]|nr:CBS domain-containing protein [Gemmatimonadota bacterium]